MSRYRLTKADRIKGMKAAVKSAKTPKHLKRELRRHLKSIGERI